MLMVKFVCIQGRIVRALLFAVALCMSICVFIFIFLGGTDFFVCFLHRRDFFRLFGKDNLTVNCDA